MVKAEITFGDPAEQTSAVPTAVTADLPFSMVKAHLSTKPLRRHDPDYGRPFTSEELAKLSEHAKRNPPPQAWLDEDFSGLQ